MATDREAGGSDLVRRCTGGSCDLRLRGLRLDRGGVLELMEFNYLEKDRNCNSQVHSGRFKVGYNFFLYMYICVFTDTKVS